MRKFPRFVLTLALAAIIATPLIAADKKKKGKKKKKRRARAVVVVRLPKSINLTDEQKAKVAAINKEYAPKAREIQQQQFKLITPEQRKARTEAVQAARKSGKKGKAFREAVQAAFKLTDEQKKQMKEVGKARAALQKEVRAKISEILTDEQKEQLKKGRKKGKGKRKKKKAKAADK